MARDAGAGLKVHARLTIPWREIGLQAARSGGPGGQNVNKVASKVVLRFSIATSAALGERRRAILMKRLGPRLSRQGEVIIHASRHRERARNTSDACDRLAALLREALRPRQTRRVTKPTAGSVRRRRAAKQRRAALKQTRRPAGGKDE